MVLEVRGRLENGSIVSELPFDQLAAAVMTTGVAVLKRVFDPPTVRNVRDQVLAWGQQTKVLPHGIGLQDVSTDLNYHRIDPDPAKSSNPHIFHFFTFNRLDLLPEQFRNTLLKMFEPIRQLQNRIAGTDAYFSPTSDPYKLRPQVMHYPSGGGFFCEHSHDLEPQRIGLVVSLSERGVDHRTGATCFRLGEEQVDTSPMHDIGDILLFRYDVPHSVSAVDVDVTTIDWSSSAGRWSMVLPYH